jgi:hypothetical protein
MRLARPAQVWVKSWKACDTNAYYNTCADCVYLVPGNHFLRSMPGLGMTHQMPYFDPS